MSNTYLHSVKAITKSTESLKNILSKVPAYLESKKDMRGNDTISEMYVLEARIAPDMYSLKKQIQLVSDNLKGIVSRTSGTENPKMEDTETTLEELIQRLQKTLDFANSIPESAYQDAENRKATMPWMPGKYQKMEDYVIETGLPNFYFHLVTAYNILRNLGLDIGKRDFIGGLTLQDMETDTKSN